MRTLHSFAVVCVIGAAAASLAACSGSDDPGTGGGAGASAAGAHAGGSSGSTAGASNAGAAALVGDATRGAPLYSTNCTGCHGADAAGAQGPNITMSKTAGIGNWTDAQFYNAVRNAKDTDGSDLCFLMSKFEVKTISDQGIQDIFAAIKAKPISDVMTEWSYKPSCQ